MSEPALPDLLQAGSERLLAMHRAQVHRAPWPDPEVFDPARYPRELRRAAAVQWAGRARAEYGSVHQFTQVAHALCVARVPLTLFGSLARLITDEVRHAELCAATALAIDPEATARTLRLPSPRTPWKAPPLGDAREPLLAWASRAILVACCLGETLSRPMLEAIALRATDPLPQGVADQILRDEHLHATFGWEALAALWPELSDASRTRLQRTLTQALGDFEASTACGIPVEALVGKELEIDADPDTPNLGTLSDEDYAAIFFATVEHEILPKLEAQGLDAGRAWAERPRPTPART
ncbi:MAG: hypothetical protein R3F62_18145 [Planctomycetota bacterium]